MVAIAATGSTATTMTTTTTVALPSGPGMRDKTHSLFAVSVVLIVLTTAAICMRVVVRGFVLRSLAYEDVLISLSWVFLTAFNVCVIISSRLGFGIPVEFVSKPDLITIKKLQIVFSTTYSVSITLAKASYAVLYLRLLSNGRRWHVLLNQTVLVILSCQAVEECLTVIFECRPIPKAWDDDVEGVCIPLRPVWYTGFTANLVVDLLMFIQPIPWMWSLKLPLIKRLGLIMVMSLGLLVVIISAMRLFFVNLIRNDLTYDYAEPIIWSQAEVAALVICSCLPSLRLLFREVPTAVHSRWRTCAGWLRVLDPCFGPDDHYHHRRRRGRNNNHDRKNRHHWFGRNYMDRKEEKPKLDKGRGRADGYASWPRTTTTIMTSDMDLEMTNMSSYMTIRTSHLESVGSSRARGGGGLYSSSRGDEDAEGGGSCSRWSEGPMTPPPPPRSGYVKGVAVLEHDDDDGEEEAADSGLLVLPSGPVDMVAQARTTTTGHPRCCVYRPETRPPWEDLEIWGAEYFEER